MHVSKDAPSARPCSAVDVLEEKSDRAPSKTRGDGPIVRPKSMRRYILERIRLQVCCEINRLREQAVGEHCGSPQDRSCFYSVRFGSRLAISAGSRI